MIVFEATAQSAPYYVLRVVGIRLFTCYLCRMMTGKFELKEC